MDATPHPRVQVINQHLDAWGLYGTVRVRDRRGQFWVKLDGYATFFPFQESDLQKVDNQNAHL